jgi:hypothetical protein
MSTLQTVPSAIRTFRAFLNHQRKTLQGVAHRVVIGLDIPPGESKKKTEAMEALLNQLQRAEPGVVTWFRSSHDSQEVVSTRKAFFAPEELKEPDSRYSYERCSGEGRGNEICLDRVKSERYMTTFLQLLDRCRTEFCVHFDSDMLVHGGFERRGGESWAQCAMNAMKENPWQVNIAPGSCPEERPSDSTQRIRSFVQGAPRFFSSQAMLFHKQRLLQFTTKYTRFEPGKAIEQVVDNSFYREHDALQKEYIAKGFEVHRETIVNPLEEDEPVYQRLTAVYRTGTVQGAWTIHPPTEEEEQGFFESNVQRFMRLIEDGRWRGGGEDCDIMVDPQAWLRDLKPVNQMSRSS